MLRRLERAGVVERQPRPGGYAPPARLPHARRHQAGAVGYRHLAQLRPGSRPGWPRPSRRSCAVCCCRCWATSPRRGRDGLDDGYYSAK